MGMMRKLRRQHDRWTGAVGSQLARGVLATIKRAAPLDPMTGERTAFYGARCCWWATDRRKLGRIDTGRPAGGLPCCPHCQSVLFEAPLDKFIASAQEHAEHYGPGGLATFAAAHDAPCHPTWADYGAS